MGALFSLLFFHLLVCSSFSSLSFSFCFSFFFFLFLIKNQPISEIIKRGKKRVFPEFFAKRFDSETDQTFCSFAIEEKKKIMLTFHTFEAPQKGERGDGA